MINKLLLAKILWALLLTTTGILLFLQHQASVAEAREKDSHRPATEIEKKQEKEFLRMDSKAIQEYRPK